MGRPKYDRRTLRDQKLDPAVINARPAWDGYQLDLVEHINAMPPVGATYSCAQEAPNGR